MKRFFQIPWWRFSVAFLLLILASVANASAKMSNTLTDIKGITVGHVENKKALKGTTVIRFEKEGAIAAYDSRGGAPGTRETDLLAPLNLVNRIHALVLS